MTTIYLRVGLLIQFIFLLINTCIAQSAALQRGYLQVGDTMPDYTFKGVKDYPKSTINISDFKGKWLILDMWNKGCLSCIQSFPKIERLRKEFDGKVQVFLVGLEDKEQKIQALYSSHRKYYNLNIAHVFDSSFFNLIDVHAGPYIIIISPHGVIEALTTGVNAEQMHQLMTGAYPRFQQALNRSQINEYFNSFDKSKPFLIGGNGGRDTDYFYRSLFSKWHKGLRMTTDRVDTESNQCGIGCFQAIGVDLKTLYKVAYLGSARWTMPSDKVGDQNLYGEFWSVVKLNIKDTSEFVSFSGEEAGKYCYSLQVPPTLASIENIKKIIQNDLNNNFGYQADIIKRRKPYWELSVRINKKHNQKLEGGFQRTMSTDSLHLQGIGLDVLQEYLIMYHGVQGIFLVKPSQKNTNISLHLKGMLTHFEYFRTLLKKNGLILKKKYKKMKVLQLSEKT